MSNMENEQQTYAPSSNIWMRALYMIVFAALFGLAETVLLVLAIVQFFWMLFAKEVNRGLADLGKNLGLWLAEVAAFQTASTEEKPFPWGKWPSA